MLSKIVQKVNSALKNFYIDIYNHFQFKLNLEIFGILDLRSEQSKS